MKIVLSWLREYCEWTWSEAELIEKLTMSGTEVEAVHRTGFSGDSKTFVAVRIASFEKHPNADKLSVCQVEDGQGLRQIVCGAKNFKAGDMVPCALPGAVMPAGFEIKDSKLRGERSSGMLCSGTELGLAQDADGLMILSSSITPGTPLNLLFQGETVLEVEVTPNRADLLSYRGIARELIALGATDKIFPFPQSVKLDAQSPWKVQIENPLWCPRYTACLLENVVVSESPAWLKERLQSMGLRPVNNVVDVTNYVLFEIGQPLHAFDADLLKGEIISVRQAQDEEKLLALDGKTYELKTSDLIIADGSGPVAIAGVMGGQATSVTTGTKRILLESAQFKPSVVRQTSKRLGLSSDSSYRFERGVDALAVDMALQRSIKLLLELTGARVVGAPIESTAVVITRLVVPLRPASIERILGYAVSDERVDEILGALGCQREGQAFCVPSYRPDLLREIDLIEELSRIEGMDRVRATLPRGVASRSPADVQYDREWEVRRFLVDLGYTEWLTNSLHPRQEREEDTVELLNPLTEDYAHLRSSLLTTVLPCVRHNLSHGAEGVKAFEIGTVYRQVKGRALEERRLVLIGAGMDRKEQWLEKGRTVGYYTLKGVLEMLAQKFPEIKTSQCEVLPEALLKTQGIKIPVFAAEFSLKCGLRRAAAQFSPITNFPSVRRDLAFVVERTVKNEEILQAILSTKILELQLAVCFDVFQDDKGEKLTKEKKSLAYALTYRSSERTLTDKEVSDWQNAIIQAVQSKVGAVLR
jgi:phenylalanyl-tRNA synthetase beta chain